MKIKLLFRHAFLLFAAMLLSVPALARDLPTGEDVIEVPAIGVGLCVSNTFQTNMVLQRDKSIYIWGWAEPGDLVSVMLGDHASTVMTNKEREWKVKLPAQPANDQPQTIMLRSKRKTLKLENILIGDVWLLGGQSNMEFPLEKVENGHLEIASAHYPEIRILSVPFNQGNDEEWKGFPRMWNYSAWSKRHFRKGDWDVCTPEIAKELSAIGYVFARRIHKAAGVPIGVIDISRGGTTVETWTPKEKLKTLKSPSTQAWLTKWRDDLANWDPQADLQRRIEGKINWLKKMDTEGREVSAEGKVIPSDLLPGPIANKNMPGYSYASMINPIQGLSIKGALWHQGYNNALGDLNGAEMYKDVFPAMIESWRSAFNDPAMPFAILSLCTAGDAQTLDNYSENMLNGGIDIRAVQYETFEDLYNAGDQNIGFVSTYDLRRKWFHPGLKLPAGERAARWAMATQYGFDEKSIPWKPPVITDTQAEDGSLILTFDVPVVNPVDGPIRGFAIAGADRKFYPAKAEYPEIGRDNRNRPRYDKKLLKLTSIMVKEPVAYRYAWGRNPLANVQAEGNTDVPLATQRSDDWPVHSVPLGVLPEDADRIEPLSTGEKSKLVRALSAMDQQRKLAEAKAVIKAEGLNVSD